MAEGSASPVGDRWEQPEKRVGGSSLTRRWIPRPPRISTSKRRNQEDQMSKTKWVVVLTAIGSLMAAIDTLVVSAALNTIRIDLHATVEQLEWTVNAYNLTFAVLLITAAALGDRFGRRKLYATGLGLFA